MFSSGYRADKFLLPRPVLHLQSEPERLRGELEQFLTGLSVPHSYSTTSKFANFRNRTLL